MYKAPSPSPSRNGCPCVPRFRAAPPIAGKRANGRASKVPTDGTNIPTPTRASSTSPVHRTSPLGRPSADSSREPTSVNTAKLSARPATTNSGRRCRRHQEPAAGAGAAGADRDDADNADDAAPWTGSTVGTPPAPAKKMTGSSGSTHGEMPVTRPPSRPISSKDVIPGR